MPPKATQDKPKYSAGEKVLCFHGPLLYEAKCMQVDMRDGQHKYFMHYQGWNKNWDEWVTDARIMKFNAVGLQKQKELKAFYSKPGRKLKRSELKGQEYPPPEALRRLETKTEEATPRQGRPGRPSKQDSTKSTKQDSTKSTKQDSTKSMKQDSTKSTKQDSTKSTKQEATKSATKQEPEKEESAKAETPKPPGRRGRPPSSAKAGGKREQQTATVARETSSVAETPQAGKRLRVRVELPRQLRLCLADDSDYVTGQKRLVALPPPSNQSVSGILSRFVSQLDESERESASEFAAGVRSYFDSVLASQLLYSAERQQHASLLKLHRGATPSSLYGCVHLLRLMVRMGDLLQDTKPDVNCLGLVLDYCDKLLAFVEKHLDVYVTPSHYEAAPAE